MTKVFICERKGDGAKMVKIQLEIPESVFERYKEFSKIRGNATPKQIMEAILCDGLAAPGEGKRK
jgi:hypothetical protein